jgi:hypothetical protein
MGLVFLDQGRDIVRAGRGLATPLAVGQTLSIVIDPPTELAGFRGYYINLNTGGGCLCYGGDPCTPGTDPRTRFRLQVYNYTDFDNWGRWGATDIGYTSIFNEDKAPFAHPDFPGNLDEPGLGPVDWIDFTHWMVESDPGVNTDFYIRSIEVTGPGGPTGDFDSDGDRDGADFLTWQRNLGRTGGATLAQGNADGDSDVDGNDLAIWRQQFGQTGASAVAGAVPESSTLAMAAAAAGLFGAAAVRRRPAAARTT